MSFGLSIYNSSGSFELTSLVQPPKVLLSTGSAPLNAAQTNTFGLPYVEVSLPSGDSFGGFELLDGATMFGVLPGLSANTVRMATDKATNYAVIGNGSIPAGYGIEIYSPSGDIVLSDTTAVWPIVHKQDLHSSNYTGSVTVSASRRIFVFGISCAIIKISGNVVTYAGIRRSGDTISLVRSSTTVSSSSYLGSGTLNLGERPLSLRLFEISNL